MPYRILEAESLAPMNRLLKVEAPMIARSGQAGQFAILRIDPEGERVPLTLADWDREEGSVTFVLQEVGKTSARMAMLGVGDEILDVVGPLGNPTHVEKYGTVVTVGGGLGIAPLYPVSRAFSQAGNRVISVVGARNKDLLFWTDKLKAVSEELRICTDDGSAGMKGFVSDMLKKMMYEEKIQVDYVFAVGPTIMMKVVADATRPEGIKTEVSLNPIMVDGTGMCGACRVEVGGSTYFACVDGPDFDAHQVNFDLLMKRQRLFTDREKKVYESFKGECKLQGRGAGPA
jgi:ferredoxin--NADP+ reductase